MNACTIVEPLDYVPEPEYRLVKTDKGTVKEHKQYKGVNQTVLTRCKVV